MQRLDCGASIAAAIQKGTVQNLLHAELHQRSATNRTDRLHRSDHTERPTAPTLQRGD